MVESESLVSQLPEPLHSLLLRVAEAIEVAWGVADRGEAAKERLINEGYISASNFRTVDLRRVDDKIGYIRVLKSHGVIKDAKAVTRLGVLVDFDDLDGKSHLDLEYYVLPDTQRLQNLRELAKRISECAPPNVHFELYNRNAREYPIALNNGELILNLTVYLTTNSGNVTRMGLYDQVKISLQHDGEYTLPDDFQAEFDRTSRRA